MKLETHWNEIRRLARSALQSSLHCSIATVDEQGLPHNSPIGSLLLNKDCTGIYFERFTVNMPKRFVTNKNISLLLVNSGVIFWLKSLIQGRFNTAPAVRLIGEAGELRAATEQELSRWRKKVKPLSWTKGHSLMWKDMSHVREIKFTGMEIVNAGVMTSQNWRD